MRILNLALASTLLLSGAASPVPTQEESPPRNK